MTENRENKTLEEIKDPARRAKLAGIQEVVFDLDEQLAEARTQLAIRRSESHAIVNVANNLLEEMKRITDGLKNGIYSKEETKVRVDQTRKITDLLNDMKNESSSSTRTLANRIEGLESAVSAASKRFESEALKAERYQRQAEEDAAELARRKAPEKPAAKKGANRKR